MIFLNFGMTRYQHEHYKRGSDSEWKCLPAYLLAKPNCQKFLYYVTEASIGKVFLCTCLRQHGVSENRNMCWFVRLCAHQSVSQLFNPRCEAYYWTNNWDFIQFRCSICSASPLPGIWNVKYLNQEKLKITIFSFHDWVSGLIALMNTRSANVLGSAHIYKM